MASDGYLKRRSKLGARRYVLYSAQQRLWKIWRFLTRGSMPRLVVFVFVLFILGALLVRFMEQRAGKGDSATQIRTLIDAFWWALVTITTVGYGDKVPSTSSGKVVAGLVIVVGVAAVAVFTATVASILTAQKIKEGKGLEKIKAKGHIVICGWNYNAERIIEGLVHSKSHKNVDVVLINDLAEEVVSEVMYKYQDLSIRYVRGDFIQESVLDRANIAHAEAAIILADTHGDLREKADGRTILATLAIKSMAPDVKVCAELLDGENEQHLLRAEVDDVVVSGEYSGFLLVAAATLPGIPQVVRELLTYEEGNVFRRAKVPSGYVGKTFGELSEYFRKEHQAILVGLTSEDRAMSLEDILTDDYSMIDLFIREKFDEAGKTPFLGEKKKTQIRLNPGDGDPIKENDSAVIIARQRVRA